MRHDGLPPVDRAALQDHVRSAMRRYWPRGGAMLDRAAPQRLAFPSALSALSGVEVTLPDWARPHGVEGRLLVPREACAEPAQAQWTRVDWWLAAFLLLEGWHERAWERRHGPIHSYSFRLRDWDARVWQRAWVNRIALFLREWAARESGTDASTLFGPLPRAEISISHDVDAIDKTAAIRIKQSAFMVFNALRQLAQGRPGPASSQAARAVRFAFGRDDWSVPEQMLDLERDAGVRSQFNFYADDRAKDVTRWLFDPAYDIADSALRQRLSDLVQGGWQVGLHPSYDAWRSPELIRAQRERLQSFAPAAVTSCRQHWLRFSWQETWAAQSAAGLSQDTTLMFNDRPGLRNSAAVCWKPWHVREARPHSIVALPTMLMDSHVYDYRPMAPVERRAVLRYWIDEVIAVGGEATLLWHPHTLADDYGWADGYRELLATLAERPSEGVA